MAVASEDANDVSGDPLVDNRIKSLPARGLALVSAAALTLVGVCVAQAASAPSASAVPTSAVVFDSLPATNPGSLASYGMQAYQMREFGQRLQLGGTARMLGSIEIGFVDWACENWASGATPCTTTPGAAFTVPVTVNVYEAGASDETVGDRIATTSKDVEVPFRPSADEACGDNRWSPNGGADCFNGYYFTEVFGFEENPVLPDDVVVSVAYDTRTQGFEPTGAVGPVDSFNVAVSGTLGDVGAVADPTTSVFIDSATAAHYTPDGIDATGIDPDWLGTFHAGRSWDQAPIPIRISAVQAPAPVASLHVDPYFTAGAKYKGIGVDIRASDVSDADEVRVTVHRAVGGDIVKSSRPDGTVAGTINTGSTVTAPIVIQPGTYDEAGSGSWFPAAGVWTPETMPTGVTVEILRDDDVIVERTLSGIGTSLATLEEVMPAAPRFTNPAANYRKAENYSGITVDIRVDDVRDAEQVVVQVDRLDGGAVVKRSKPAVATAVNTGQPQSVTAPIVIQPGTYDEAASSSWLKPIAVWTPTSVPTSVTVTIERTYGPDLVTTLPIGGSIDGVMPTEAPAPAPVVVEIPTDVPSYQVDVPADLEDVELDLGAATVTSGVAAVVVPVEVVVSSAVGVDVTIAAATTASSADATWDGVIELPKARTDVVVPAASGQTTTVGVALQMGSSTARIDFDQPVKLVLADQAGKSAGYIDQSGSFHSIATACPADMPDDMSTDECWVDDGSDLVIWTTHFTTFVSYESAATVTSGGASGPGGASSGSTSGGGSGVTAGSSVTLVPAPAATAAPRSTSKPTASPTPASPSPDVPEEEVDPAAAVTPAAGGFDPFLLIAIIVAIAILGAGVATIVTLRRRAGG